MSGVLVRFLVIGFAGFFGVACLYSVARSRRLEATLYLVATASVFVMLIRSR